MSKTRRVFSIIGALFVIQGALILMLVPDMAFELIAIGIAVALTFSGIKYHKNDIMSHFFSFSCAKLRFFF